MSDQQTDAPAGAALSDEERQVFRDEGIIPEGWRWCPDCNGEGTISTMDTGPDLNESARPCTRCEAERGIVPEEGTAEPPRLSSDELTTLARRVIQNEIFIANQGVSMIAFEAIIALGNPAAHWNIETIGAVYEETSKAGPRSINGFPMFLSCQFLHAEDLPPLMAELERMRAAIGLPAEG